MTPRRSLAVLGRSAVVVATLLLGLLVVLASWLPLTLDPPRRVDNRLEVTADGVRFEPVRLARVPAGASAVRQADTDDELVLTLRVRPGDDARTPDPSRIAVLATDLRNHDLLVGQDGRDLVVRRERTLDGRTDEVEVRLPEVLAPGSWQDIEVRFTGRLLITAGRRTHVDTTFPAPQGRIPRGAQLSLGAETSGNHAWTGDIAVAQLRVGRKDLDLLDPGQLHHPRQLWLLPERLDESGMRTTGDHLRTAGWHLLASLLLGIGLALSLPRVRRPTPLLLAWATGVVAVNLVKVVIASRHPSLATALLQTAGGGIGIVQVLALRRRRRQRSGRGPGAAATGRPG